MITLPAKIAEMKELYSVFFVDLYVMKLESGTLYFAAADEGIPWYIPGTSTSVTYTALPIQRDSLKQSVDNKIDNLSLTIANCDDSFTSALLQSFDFRGSDMDVIQIAYPDSLTDETAYKYTFAGYIDAPSLDMGTSEFKCSIVQRMPNLESSRTVGQNCSAWFGDSDECGVEKVTQTSMITLESTQYTIYSSSITQAANYWQGGTITIGFESKKITSSAVGSVTVSYPFYTTPSTGTNFTLETGCDHTQTNCKKWGNLKNFGGFPCVNLEYSVKA